MSLYNLASGELKKENNKLKQEIDKLVDTNEDINREFSQYKYESKKEIERLNNIINKLEQELIKKLDAVKTFKDILGDGAYVVNPHIDLLEQEYNYFYKKLQELKGEDKE